PGVRDALVAAVRSGDAALQPAATVRRIAGALPPEVALRPDDLFAELAERGCHFDITTTPTTTSEV
ncbi:MAG: hypothetical protein M3P44_14570, partial [Actinomycetota bacterium]|nr:hypothetical protein [Actinomycetota bacterium]